MTLGVVFVRIPIELVFIGITSFNGREAKHAASLPLLI
jgi:hypothetical protein